MTTVFAHRGSLTEAPENSLPSFQRAIDRGTKAIELDVQLSKDGYLVLCHDAKINRVSKRSKGYIKDFTLEELKCINVASAFDENYPRTTFCTLDEVLEVCPENILINVEIKNIPIIYEGIEKKVMDSLQEYDRMDNVIISSFDHSALKRVQNLGFEGKIGLLFNDLLIEPWKYAKATGIEAYSLHPRYEFVDQHYVNKCHENGYKVIPFTVDHEDVFSKLIDLNVDGVFSNNPRLFGN